MNEAADLTAALAAVTAVAPRFLTSSDTEFLADLELVERIGRVIDGLRVTGAAEAERRSRKTLGEESLALDRPEGLGLATGPDAPKADPRPSRPGETQTGAQPVDAAEYH